MHQGNVSPRGNLWTRLKETARKRLWLLFLLLLPMAAQAQDYRVFLDADLDDATGCTVSLANAAGAQSFTGFEYRLDVSVANTTVNQTQFAACNGSSFTSPQPLGSPSHPLALTDLGAAVTDHIELGLPLAQLNVAGVQVRLVIAASGDYLATISPSNSGAILMPLAFSGGEPHGIPLFPPLALALLGIAVAFAGWRSQRKQHVGAMCLSLVAAGALLSISLAWAAGRIPFDGNLTGWGGMPPLATGAANDNRSGSPDLLKLYAAVDDGELKLRLDANSGRTSVTPSPVPMPADPLDARLPTLSPSSLQRLAVDQPWHLDLQAKDHQGVSLSITVVSQPSLTGGPTISGSNPLQLDWTPTTQHIGQHIITVSVTDGEGRHIVHDLILAVADPTDLPANPGDVATPLVPGSTPFDEAHEFLYTGSDPIQQGVANGTIKAEQAGVIRGLVKDRAGNPLAGVTVSILNHPQYGATKTRADGWFDMAANGGGLLVLDYRKPGYLAAQRKIDLPWRDYVIAEDVALVTADNKATPVKLGHDEWQVGIGTETTDDRGNRTAVVLFPPNTRATMKMRDGSTKPLDHLTFRATEFTIGDTGPAAMPGELPISVGYTYAAELSADEALAAGAASVEFDRPLPFYVDNFVGFPAGSIVPIGWYDYQRAAWIGSDDGRVVKIMRIEDGKAILQVTEASRAATAAELAQLGITDEEREALAKIYSAGKTLWRSPVGHFTPWDCNFPYGPPPDIDGPPPSDDPPPPDDTPPSEPPPPDDNSGDDEDNYDKDDDNEACADDCGDCTPAAGCEIFHRGVVGQRIAIPGSPLRLRYRSDRASIAPYAVTLTSVHRNVSPSLKKIEARIDIAGVRHTETIAGGFQPGMKWRFNWDGKDAYGRSVNTRAAARVKVTQHYPLVYLLPAEMEELRSSFATVMARMGYASGSNTVFSAGGNFESGREWKADIHAVAPPVEIARVGGWMLEGLSFYDPNYQRYYLKNGDIKSGKSLPWDLQTIFTSTMGEVRSLIGQRDGAFLATFQHGTRILRIAPDGSSTTIAGSGSNGGYSGDGGPATEAQVSGPQYLSEGLDGSLYFVDQGGAHIRRIDPQGIIQTIAGNGSASGQINSTGKALDTRLNATDLTVDRDGNLFFAQMNALSQIDATGYLSRVHVFPAGEPITSLAADPASGVWIATNRKIYFLSPGGALIEKAGGGNLQSDGQGSVLALGGATQLSPNREGGVYFAQNSQLRLLDSGGEVTTIIREGSNVLAKKILMMPGKEIYAMRDREIVRRRNGLPDYGQTGYMLPRDDGEAIDVFDRYGRLLEIRSSVTGATLWIISYANGHPVGMTDFNGNTLALERDGSGLLTAIVGLHGERTALGYDGNGMLNRVTLPGGHSHRMEYSSLPGQKTLMTAYTDPNGHTDRFEYYGNGRLKRNVNPEGNGWTRGVQRRSFGATVIKTHTLTSASGRFRHYSGYKDNWKYQNTFNALGVGNKWNSLIGYGDGNKSWEKELANGTRLSGNAYIPLHKGPQAMEDHRYVDYGQNQVLQVAELRNIQNGSGYWNSSYAVNGYGSTTTYYSDQLFYNTPVGRGWNAWVDEYMRIHRLARPAMSPLEFTYDSRGNLTRRETYGDVGGGNYQSRISESTYLGNGRLESTTNEVGQTAHYSYTPSGRLSSVALPGSRAIGFGYDGNGNLTAVTTPAGITHRFEFSGVNQLKGYEAPAGTTTWQYNRDGELARIIRPGGQNVALEYDAGGQMKKLIMDEGSITASYNDKTLVTQLANSDVTMNITYRGALQAGTTVSGKIRGSVETGRSVSDRLLPTVLKVSAGNDNFLINRTFDAANRPTGISVGNIDIGLGYGDNYSIAGMSLGDYASNWRYNDFGESHIVTHATPLGVGESAEMEAMRAAFIAKVEVLRGNLLAESARLGTCMRRGWDLNVYYNGDHGWGPGLIPDPWAYEDQVSQESRERYTDELGPPVTRSPDYCAEWINGTAAGITETASSSGFQWADWVGSELNGWRSNATGGAATISGVMTDATSFVTPTGARLFDELEALRSAIAANIANLTILARYEYQRDELGRITRLDDSVGSLTVSHQYQYDAIGQLHSHTKEGVTTTWEYDANGNRVVENGTTIASYDSEDRLLNFRGIAYSYTPAGDLASKTDTGGTTAYRYDALGNLRSVTLSNGDEIDYLIDPYNRRVGKQKNGVLQYGLLYLDRLRPIAELKPAGGIRSLFLYGGNENVPYAMIRGGVLYRILTDHLGSVRSVIDTRNRNTVQAIEYDVWGKIIHDSSPGFQPFGFAGGLYDPDTGLTRFGARDYDAEVGRWTAKDPILFAGGDTNLYGYVTNDPVNWNDPMGLWRNPLEIPPEAAEKAYELEKEGAHGGAQDALRHCIASCIMTVENTSVVSAILGRGYEIRGDLIDNQSVEDRKMDDHNNSCGNKLGKELTNANDCADSCNQAMSRGELYLIQGEDTSKTYWNHYFTRFPRQ